MPRKQNVEQYVVVRDFGQHTAGDTVTLEPADAALLVRDGFVAPAQEK